MPDDRAGRPIALLATHAVLALLLIVGAVGLAVPSSDADNGVFGILLLAELVLLGIAAGIVAAFDRHGPLVLVDVLIATPLVAGLARGGSLGQGAVVLGGLGIVAAALTGAILAAGRVRGRAIERLGVAVALSGLVLTFVGTLIAAAVPALALAVVAAPDLRRRRSPDPVAARPRGARARRAAAPDAATILARRPVDRDGPA